MPRFEEDWQSSVEKKIGSLEPFFSRNSQLKIRALAKQNLILVAADVDYALENINFLLMYSKLFSKQKSMPRLVCAIFNSSCIDTSFPENYAKLCSILDSRNGIVVVEFLAHYFSSCKPYAGDSVYFRNLIVNYIKCARFSLVQKLWRLTGCKESRLNIGKSNFLVYVMDYDFVANDNFDIAIRANYYRSSCLLSYAISGESQKFEQTLCKSSTECIDPKLNVYSVDLSLSHKVIKAGFSCFSPSPVSNYLFHFFNCYAFQLGAMSKEPVERFLFSHYYGDQLSLIAAVRDLRYTCEENYFNDLAWVNLKKSNIVNLDSSHTPLLYLPKGNLLG